MSAQRKIECNHDWKAIDTTPDKSHVILKCKKCGEVKEVELFP